MSAIEFLDQLQRDSLWRRDDDSDDSDDEGDDDAGKAGKFGKDKAGDDDEEDDDHETTTTIQTSSSSTSRISSSTLQTSTLQTTTQQTTTMQTSTSSQARTSTSTTRSSTTSLVSSTTSARSVTQTSVQATVVTSAPLTTTAVVSPTDESESVFTATSTVGRGESRPTTSTMTSAIATTTAISAVGGTSRTGASKAVTAGIAISIVILAIGIFVLLFFLGRRYFRNKASSSNVSEKGAPGARSVWGGIWGGATTVAAPTVRADSVYHPPLHEHPAVEHNLDPSPATEDNGFMRKLRLARVRTDLLSEKELRTGLTPAPPKKPWVGGMGNPWKTVSVKDSERLDIEAGGMWEAPVTVAKRASRTESEFSQPRWRTPMSWVRDQRRREWGKLDG